MMQRLMVLPGLVSCLALCLALCGCEVDDGAGERAGAHSVLESCRGRAVNVGFYADFAPLSYSQDNQAPTHSEAYNAHRGYEADLLTALEALGGAGLSFSRRGIAPDERTAGRTFPFAGIWLLAAEPDYDLIGGGITLRDDRTRNAAGQQVVAFTAGHVAFRQSLLVRREDARRLAGHGDLTANDVVSVHRGTTGEERFLRLVGIVDSRGVVVAGTRIVTPRGELTADGGTAYVITAAMASPHLAARQRLIPPAPLPQVIIHASEDQQLGALENDEVTAVARGGTSATSTRRRPLAAPSRSRPWIRRPSTVASRSMLMTPSCWLVWTMPFGLVTDGGRIGYREWAENPRVFLERVDARKAE